MVFPGRTRAASTCWLSSLSSSSPSKASRSPPSLESFVPACPCPPTSIWCQSHKTFPSLTLIMWNNKLTAHLSLIYIGGNIGNNDRLCACLGHLWRLDTVRIISISVTLPRHCNIADIFASKLHQCKWAIEPYWHWRSLAQIRQWQWHLTVTTALALVTLGEATQIEMILSMLRCPNGEASNVKYRPWPRLQILD